MALQPTFEFTNEQLGEVWKRLMNGDRWLDIQESNTLWRTISYNAWIKRIRKNLEDAGYPLTGLIEGTDKTMGVNDLRHVIRFQHVLQTPTTVRINGIPRAVLVSRDYFEELLYYKELAGEAEKETETV